MSRESAELSAQVHEAAARLLHAYTRLQPALKALHEHSPGFPSGLEPPAATPSEDGEPDQQTSQPERWEDMATDEAVTDLKKLRAEVRKAFGAAATIYDLATRWSVTPSAHTDEAPEGACESCFRHRRHYSPVATGRYKRYCTFCGQFNGNYGMIPPMPILRLHHDGRRISVQQVEKYVGKKGRKAS